MQLIAIVWCVWWCFIAHQMIISLHEHISLRPDYKFGWIKKKCIAKIMIFFCYIKQIELPLCMLKNEVLETQYIHTFIVVYSFIKRIIIIVIIMKLVRLLIVYMRCSYVLYIHWKRCILNIKYNLLACTWLIKAMIRELMNIINLNIARSVMVILIFILITLKQIDLHC